MAMNICVNKKWVLLAKYARRHHAVHQDVPHNRTKSRKPKSRDSWNLYLCQQGLRKVSLDFITHHPKVAEYDAILVVVDQFSKYATFVPTPKLCSAELTVQLYFKHIVKLWDIPLSIISGSDGRFIGTF